MLLRPPSRRLDSSRALARTLSKLALGCACDEKPKRAKRSGPTRARVRDPANVREYSQRPRQFSADLPFDRLRTGDAAGLDVPEPVGRGAERGVIFGEKEVIMKRSFDEGAIQLSHLLGCRTANSRERRECFRPSSRN